jgi:hypothetical protein
MRFHDFHLCGYTVREFGGEIVLHLVYDYPNSPVEESHIRFRGVELYHFVHTGGAIILDIAKTSLADIIDQHWDSIVSWAHQHGVGRSADDRAGYLASLEADSLRGWSIASAVGFEGFVIARTIEDVTREHHETPNQAMERTSDRSEPRF